MAPSFQRCRQVHAMDIVFVYQYTCLSASPCAPQVFARVLALTSDSNLRNNSVTLAVPTTVGFKAEIDSLQPVLHRRLAYYRSDAPTFDGTSLFFDPPLTADPSLTVWVPIQTAAGNVWYFDSWADGNRENPRTFDASNGIELSQGRIKFRTANPFGTDPGSLDLVAAPGSNSVSQKLTLYPTDQAGKWSIGTPSASWLAVAVGATNSSDGTAVVTGTADVRGIAPGLYTATFPVKPVAAGYPEITMDVPATLRVLEREPTIAATGFVSAASFQGGPPASNEIITIFGSGLGPSQLINAFVPEAGSLATSLGGTSVEFQGEPLQLLYVQDQSIAAILPTTIYGAPGQLQIKLGGTVGPSASIPAPPYGPGVNGSSFAPALFTLNSSGQGNVAAVNADGTINSPNRPAARGSLVLLFGTGFRGCGDRNFGFPFPDSTLVPGNPSPVEAFIGRKPAYILYSGSAPATTCGLQQFNLVIPDDSDTGPAVPLRLSIPYPGSSIFDPYGWFVTPSGDR